MIALAKFQILLVDIPCNLMIESGSKEEIDKTGACYLYLLKFYSS
jgi:hypothetical protein